MTANDIASSQLADSADIPRPTLSQLLNGRNKKISNELIGKIHDAYPSLNVLWLMFGEGDMEAAPEIKTSEAQKDAQAHYSPAQSANSWAVGSMDSPSSGATAYRRNETQTVHRQPESAPRPVLERPLPEEAMQALSNYGLREPDGARVQQIMVLYTDGRFQTFMPTD